MDESDRERRSKWPVRVIPATAEAHLQDRIETIRYWRSRSPEERFEAMFDLIELGLAIRAENYGEELSPRLDRTIVRVQRARQSRGR